MRRIDGPHAELGKLPKTRQGGQREERRERAWRADDSGLAKTKGQGAQGAWGQVGPPWYDRWSGMSTTKTNVSLAYSRTINTSSIFKGALYQRSWNCIIGTSTLTSMYKRNLNATPDTHNMKTKRAVQINMCCIGCSEYTPARACTLSKESICRVPFFQGKKKHSPCDFRFLPDGSGPRRVVTQTTDPMQKTLAVHR